MERPYMVGIAGGSACGKTTLSQKLEQALADCSARFFHMDEYFKYPVPKTTAPVTGIEYDEFNHPDAVEFDRLLGDIELARRGTECRIIVVEGILVLAQKQLRELLDLKVFVDCQADERLVRRIRRNMGWGMEFDQVTGVYLDSVRYRHDELIEPSKWQADVILNGAYPSDLGTEMLLDFIRKQAGFPA